MIGRDQIESLIPHAGSMCLIDEVVIWTSDQIHCRSSTHGDPLHPLRRDECLSNIHLIEYCAQAMAIHGGLCAQQAGIKPRSGLLVAAKGIEFAGPSRLDQMGGTLELYAQQLLANAQGWLYSVKAEIKLDTHVSTLLKGRLSVMLTTSVDSI